MSWMELKIINKDGDILTSKEYKNAWGGAAFIWDALCKKYDVKDKYGYHSFNAWQILWDRVRDKKIILKPFEYNVLYFTYDNALIKKEDIQLFAESLRMFNTEHNNDRVNHCITIANDIDQYIKDDDIYGLGLYATSVGDDSWVEYNEDEDEYRCYNINNGNKHWYIDMVQLGEIK